MTQITIPQLDANIVDVTITRWHKQVGDTVEKGEVIAVLTTDKAAYDFESCASGVLLAIFAPVKSIVPTGTVIGVIGQPGERAESMDVPGPRVMSEPLVTNSEGPCRRASAAPAQPRVRATPRARRLASENGFDLAAIAAAVGVDIVDEAAVAAYKQSRGGNR
jgi:pyruvate dehydrogenase E2 component (dihydrolipoamide acetyltransferase)